ncbi:MAG: EAL and modified HD-GYP domain-containing signal transduction protein [Gammaproteobacteria bacterium]|jgi:EAL and modified HD-GYP domain-containing signal transduction protein
MFTVKASSIAQQKVRPPSVEALVARQPIFDRSKKLYAYELLYRCKSMHEAGVEDGDQATAHVVTSSFLDIGLDRVIGASPAFINATYNFLVSRAALALPPEKIVLEILEDVVVDDALVEAVAEYVAAGYRIALDDFEFSEVWRPLLHLAHIVKLDVMALDIETLREHVALLAEFNVELLAEKVESESEFHALADLGFDYFQGYFFAKPTIVSAQRLSANKLAALNLLAKLQDPNADIDEIAALVAMDPALSYRLLRFMNSASLGLPETVLTIQRVVVYLGLVAVKRWVTLIVLASVGDKPSELTGTVLVRARMTELLCISSAHSSPDSAFTVGLFSALDAFMDRPLPELLMELPLSRAVHKALLEGSGPEGEALQCVLAYEKGQWERAEFYSDGLALEELAELYAQSVQWADEARSESNTHS